MATTKSDMSRHEAGRDSTRQGSKRGSTRPKIRDESDLGSDMQGKNSLQGDDQTMRHNQRQTTPDEGG